MMSSDKNDIIQKTHQSVASGTADPNPQHQDEEDAVSMNDGIQSDLTSSVSASGDVTGGFTGASVSETLPPCLSGSTSIGVQNETVNGSAIAESNPKHPGLVTPTSSMSTERNSNLTRKLLKAAANLKRDNKMPNKGNVILTPKSECLTETPTPLSLDAMDDQLSITSNGQPSITSNSNGAPHLRSANYTAASVPRANNQMKKFSSVTNPRCHAFPPANYRTNGTVSSVNDRFLSTDKIRSGKSEISAELNWGLRGHYDNFTPQSSAKDETCVNDRCLSTDKLRSGESEMLMEITRGPRGYYGKFALQSSDTKDDFAITICRDKYNLSDFQTEYETAKFYVIKSFNEDDIHKSIKYDVWTSTSHGNRKLNAAFLDVEAKLFQTGIKCPVFLFFSVNASGQFVGVAEMLGPVDDKKDMKFWKLDKYNGFFPIRWHIIKDVPNNQLRHIILENNENRPVTFTRDTQEIGLKQGLEMLKIFKSYSAKTSLLDDFDLYEKREKLLHSERSSKHAVREPEAHGYDNYRQNTVRAGKKKIEMQSSVNQQVNLVNLTKNLSLNPYGK